MAKALKFVGIIAGIAAMAIPVVGPAIGMKAIAIGSASAIASGVAMLASTGAQLLRKPPPARGSVTNILIDPNARSPYVIGRTYSGGVLRYDRGWGGKVGKVHNPYRAMAMVHSVGGPIDAFEAHLADFQPLALTGGAAGGFYRDFLWVDERRGLRPDSALAPHWPGAPGWGVASKLSGKAAVMWSALFDKDGVVFASGIPQLGSVLRGVWAYDPRLDATRPGGVGSHRWDDESSWSYTRNPALHALTYARGRYVNGKKVFGCGFPADGLLIDQFAALANVCDANGWTCGGILYEPGDRWENLRHILAAAGAEPVLSGGLLGVRYDAPRVPIDTIRADDIGEGRISLPPMQSWRARINTLIPKYCSEANKWDRAEGAAVSIAAYVTEDGETKIDSDDRLLVQDPDQAAQLAAYRLVNAREMAPIMLPLKPRMMAYRPGDMLLAGADLPPQIAGKKLIMLTRQPDPLRMTMVATFMTESDGKHDFALGRTGTPPPTPSLLVPGELDEAMAGNTVASAPTITRHPDLFPATATANSLHFDADNVPWIWVGGDLTIGGEPVTIGGEAITMPGWVRLRDSGVEAAMAAADAAIDALDDLADDGILTPDEKIRILIPEDARLEGAWNALSAAAATAGVSTAAAGAARATWLTLRDGLNPAWNDIGASTVVDRVSYRATFVAYSDALDALNRAVLEAMPGAQQVTVAPPAGYTVACTAAGAPKAGALPKVLTPAVTRGGSDVRTSDDVSYAISAPAALDASVNSTEGSADKGRITIGTGWTGPGTIQLTVTVAGIDYGPFPIVIERALDGAAATGGSGGGAGPAYDYSFTQLSSTAFVPISDELGPLNLAAGQSLKVTASLEYQLTGTGNAMSRTVTAKAQYWDGAAWLDFAGGGAVGSPATWFADQFGGDPGTLDLVATQAGLAAGSYKVRLVASISSTAQAATIFFNGSSQMIFEVV